MPNLELLLESEVKKAYKTAEIDGLILSHSNLKELLAISRGVVVGSSIRSSIEDKARFMRESAYYNNVIDRFLRSLKMSKVELERQSKVIENSVHDIVYGTTSFVGKIKKAVALSHSDAVFYYLRARVFCTCDDASLDVANKSLQKMYDCLNGIGEDQARKAKERVEYLRSVSSETDKYFIDESMHRTNDLSGTQIHLALAGSKSDF